MIDMKDIAALEFLYHRLKEKHREYDTYDYMIRFRQIIKELRNTIWLSDSSRIREDKVIKMEPRMVKEDFSDKKSDKLVLLIHTPKEMPLQMIQETFSQKQDDVLFDNIAHYYVQDDVDNVEIEVLNKPPNEISILWGLFKWTYK